jgi:hypothetical protein
MFNQKSLVSCGYCGPIPRAEAARNLKLIIRLRLAPRLRMRELYPRSAMLLHNVIKIIEAIPLTGLRGPQICNTSRLPYFLDNRLTDGGEVVSLTRRPPFTPRNTSSTHFCYRLSRHQGHSAAGRIRSTEKSSDLIRNQTRDHPACIIVPQPTGLPRALCRCD